MGLPRWLQRTLWAVIVAVVVWILFRDWLIHSVMSVT